MAAVASDDDGIVAPYYTSEADADGVGVFGVERGADLAAYVVCFEDAGVKLVAYHCSCIHIFRALPISAHRKRVPKPPTGKMAVVMFCGMGVSSMLDASC